jgi:23S rRNA (guanosine2251-2'-O)-methyltransferase
MVRHRTTERPIVVHGVNAVLELLRSETPLERVLVQPGARTAAVGEAARRRGVACATADRGLLDRTAGSPDHQGAVAVGVRVRWATLEDIAVPSCRGALCLDGVQDPRNLGAILRSARAAGIGGVVLPQDRSAGVTPVVAVSSAGAVFGLAIARVPNLVRAMEGLKTAGFWTVGLAGDARTSLWDLDVPQRPALVVGGEGEGLRPLVRRTCDFEASIPMAAGVESLNVSVATGVALFELRRRGILRS